VPHIDEIQQYAHRQPKPKNAYKNPPGRDPQAGHTKTNRKHPLKAQTEHQNNTKDRDRQTVTAAEKQPQLPSAQAANSRINPGKNPQESRTQTTKKQTCRTRPTTPFY